MDQNFLFNMGLILIVIGLGLAYLFYTRMRDKALHANTCDPQLKTVMDFMNAVLVDTMDRLTRPIDDSLESEYSDNMHYLREQAGRHLTIVTDYSKWVGTVSEYPGWAVHIMTINGDHDNEADYYKPWIITVSFGPSESREYVIPQQNIAHLIDCLESMNNYNEKLIEMIKTSEE